MARIDLQLKNTDAGGASLTLPNIIGLTDQEGWPGRRTDNTAGGTQGLNTKELAASLAAPYLEHNAIEVTADSSGETPSTTDIWGERTLLLKCPAITLGNGKTQGQRLMLVCQSASGCTVSHSNNVILTLGNGKIRALLWNGSTWTLADRQNTSTLADADTIMLRDANGRVQVASPSAANDAANKAYVNQCVNNRISVSVSNGVATIRLTTQA